MTFPKLLVLIKPVSGYNKAITLAIRYGLLTLLWTGESALWKEAPGAASPQTGSATIAQIPLQATVFYVNPAAGNDGPGAGSQSSPFRTITAALRQANPGTVVKLERGSYTQQTGEIFPLTIPQGVMVLGEEDSKGQTVAIIGGDVLISPTFARQNATILAGKDSEIRGISVTNPNVRGTGIWIESTHPTIKNCTFSNNNREGIFVTGDGNPKIEKNVFIKNGGNGLSTASNARGEIRDNLFQNTGFGLAIGGNSAPLVVVNKIVENTDGIYINDSARPILRGNVIENNKRDGIVTTINAQPDLGNEQDAGNNVIRNNRQYDLNNATRGILYSVGNTLDPSRINGRVEFVASDSGSIFPDVQGHWAQAYIDALAKRNVISGFPDGRFRPSEPVTRAQFAAIANKAFAPVPKWSRIEFKDVPTSFWGNEAIQSVVQGGFMKGYPEGVFNPEQRIPKVQVLVSLASGLGFSAENASILSKYQDAAQIPSWALGAVAAATQRKIVVNYPTVDQLSPNRDATRAEVAALVYQALVNAGKVEPIPSPYIVAKGIF